MRHNSLRGVLTIGERIAESVPEPLRAKASMLAGADFEKRISGKIDQFDL